MKRFNFRLQKVLEVRETAEERAKQTFGHAQQALLGGQATLTEMKASRNRTASAPCGTFQDRVTLEGVLARMTMAERHFQIQLNDLERDAHQALVRYTAARQEAEILRKLRENALEVWRLESERKEQADLDEWATQRRAR